MWSDTFEIVRGQDKSDFYLPLNVRFTGEEAVEEVQQENSLVYFFKV